MGWAERANPRSAWSVKRNGPVLPFDPKKPVLKVDRGEMIPPEDRQKKPLNELIKKERSMDNRSPKWIRMAQKAFHRLTNRRGEVVIPFMESVAEEQRPAVQSFVTNTGASTEELANYSTFDEFLGGYKPKSQPDWVSTLPDEDKTFLKVKGWKSPADTIKSYKDLEKLVGHDKIALPRKDASGNYDKTDLDRVLGQLGRPKDPKEYKVSESFKLPDGIQLDEQKMIEFNDRAHKAGLLPSQYAFMMDELSGLLNQGVKAQKDAQEKAYNDSANALRQKWGLAFEQNQKLANAILRNYSGDKQGEVVKKYGNDPVLIELLADIGQDLSEESIARSNMTGTVLTPEAARLEIDKIRREQQKPLLDNGHPEHKYWLKRLDDLYKMASA